MTQKINVIELLKMEIATIDDKIFYHNMKDRFTNEDWDKLKELERERDYLYRTIAEIEKNEKLNIA